MQLDRGLYDTAGTVYWSETDSCTSTDVWMQGVCMSSRQDEKNSQTERLHSNFTSVHFLREDSRHDGKH